MTAAVVGFSGFSGLMDAQSASAVSKVTVGNATTMSKIALDYPLPLSSVELSQGGSMQVTHRTLGKAFYGTGNSYPMIVDLDTGTAMGFPTGAPFPNETRMTVGGTGTVADPFWMKSVNNFGGTYSNLKQTQKISHVAGTDYVRNDITLSVHPSSSKTFNMQIGQWGDCFFGSGGDSGRANIEAGRVAQCISKTVDSQRISLIPSTPGSMMVAGGVGGTRNALLSPLAGKPYVDKCTLDQNPPTVNNDCSTIMDNAFSVAWDATVSPTQSATVTSYVSYSDNLAIVNMAPSVSVAPATAGIGQDVTYTLSLANSGPYDAADSTATFQLPAGMTYVSSNGDGSYDSASGTWTVGTVANGGSASINIVAKAATIGTKTAQVSSVGTSAINQTPCAAGVGCGDPAVVNVLETGSATKAQLGAAPATVTADGSAASTITVTAFTAGGTRVNIGGAAVELTTDLGELSDVVDNQNGTYTATLTSSVAGNATVGLKMNGSVAPATAKVKFVAGNTDPAAAGTKYTVSDASQLVGTGENTVTVTLADAKGNPVAGKEELLEATTADDLGTGSISDFTESSTVAGTYTAKVKSTKTGAKAIEATLDETALRLEGNGNAVFHAGPVDPSNAAASFAVSGGKEAIVTGKHTVTVKLADQYGNAVTGMPANKFAATASAGAEIGAFAESGTTPGTYEATITSDTVGDNTITVKVDGVVVNAEGVLDVAKFVAGPVDLANEGSGFEVTTDEQSIEGGSHQVTVKLADDRGNPVSLFAAELAKLVGTATPSAGVTVGSFLEVEGEPGSYAATVTSTKVGDKTIAVTLDGNDVTSTGNKVASFSAGGPSTENAGTNYAVSTGTAQVGSGSHEVTVNVTDADGNPVSGLAQEAFVFAADPAAGVSFDTFTAGAGVYKMTLSSESAGVKDISVSLGANAIKLATDATATAEFVAGAPVLNDANLVNYTVSSEQIVAGSGAHTITVKLADEFGNPVKNQAAQLSAATVAELGSGNVTGFAESSDGVYVATVTSTVAGVKPVTVKHGTTALSVLPVTGNANATFIADEASAESEETSYSVSENSVLVGTGTHTITVLLADANGNPVAGQEELLEAATESDLGDGELGGFTESQTVAGTYTASVTSTKSGAKAITVKFDGADVRLEGNGNAMFHAAAADPGNTIATTYNVSTGTKPVVSGEHTVTVVLADEYDNPVTDEAEWLKATTSDDLGEGAISDFTETEEGTYEATVTSSLVGKKTIKAFFVDDEIALTETDGNKTAEFVAGAIDPTSQNSGFSVTEDEQSIEGGSHTITVKLADNLGNPAILSADELAELGLAAAATKDVDGDAVADNTVTVGEFAAVDGEPGSYAATVTSSTVGAKTIVVTLDGTKVTARGNTIALFTAGGASVENEKTNYSVSEEAELVGTGSHTVTVNVADADGNPVSGLKANAFEFTADPAAGVSFDTFTAGAGEYTMTVSSTTAGKKDISVKLAGNSVNAADAANTVAEFVAGDPVLTDTELAHFAVTTDEVVAGAGSHQISVLLQDEFGNPVTGKAAQLTPATVADIGTGVFSGFTEASDGVYVATVTSTIAGAKAITVTLGADSVLAEGNANALFIPAAPAAASSTITAAPAKVQANGVSAATATVQLVDAYGNTITDAPAGTTVEIESTVGAVGTVEAGAAGTFTAPITSSEAGKATITFSVNSEAGTGTASVEFVAVGAPVVEYANGSTVVGTGVPGETIIVRDQNGNEIARETVNEDGEFVVNIPVTEDGTTLKVSSVDGNGFESDPVEIVVDAEAPEAPVVDPSNGSTISGKAEPGSTVKVTDGNGEILCEATVGADGKFSCVPSPTPSHGDTITVVVTDPSNNTSEPGTVVINQVAPEAPVVDPSNGSKITGEGQIGSEVVVKDGNGNVLCETTVGADGKFSCVPDPAPKNGDNITVTLTDKEGNTSAPETIVIDTVAPEAPVVDPSNGTNIKGEGEPGATVEVTDGNGNVLCTTTVGDDGKFSCVPDPKPGHGDTIKVVVTDPSGNSSEPGEVVINQVAPEAPVVDPSNGNKITGEGQPGSNVEVKDKDGNVLCSTTVGDDGKFICVPDPKPGHGDTIKVVVTDPSGNSSEPGEVVINQVAPEAPVVDPSNGNKITGEGQPGSNVEVKDKDGNVLCSTTVGDDGKFICVPDPKPNHGDKIEVVVTDPSGNSSEPGEVVINQVAPEAPVVDPSNGNKITGEGQPGSNVEVKDKDGNVLCSTTVGTDGKFSCVPDPAPKNGDKIEVVVTDPSGNTSKPGDVVIDTEAPGAPVVDPSNGTNIKGKGEPGATVEVTDQNGNVLCATTVGADGKFSCVPDPKPNHGDTIKVVVTDPSGNSSEPGEVIINQIAPDAPVVDPSNGTPIKGEGQPGSNVEVKDKDGNVLCTTTVGADGKFSCDPKPAPGHGDTVEVVITDPSGNTSEPGKVVINKTAPDAPKLDLSNGKTVTGGTISSDHVLTFVDGKGNQVPGTVVIDSNGRFTFTPDVPLTEKDSVRAVVTSPEGNSSEATVKVKTKAPSTPVVDPSEGDKVTGCAEPGSTVTVRDADGNVIGEAVAGDDCRFETVLNPKQKPGDSISVETKDPAGNVSGSVTIRVGKVSMVLEVPSLRAGETQTAYGYGFQPGEKVTGVLRSTPVDLGTQVADANGEVTFTFTVPADLEIGEHSVTLTGPFSGSVKDTFEVLVEKSAIELAVTGGALWFPLGAGVLLLGAGMILVVSKRRRNAEETAV
ncbi:DUF11 domain-containing protein [Leucobacter viscericola]|uniref:DUF11 domain-containing protein n=1 Tax=Leucobacter viscericola TaxID=2714935 RepID=A0A6G7XFQ6_9MICO|nr:Ig-like domain-containing protein [Leucobacter viscericola]QIK63227.1 DUF11 domain-containing protein [Leucobacter viscericola]